MLAVGDATFMCVHWVSDELSYQCLQAGARLVLSMWKCLKVRAKPEASYSEFTLSVPLYSSRAIGISTAGVVAAGTLVN